MSQFGLWSWRIDDRQPSSIIGDSLEFWSRSDLDITLNGSNVAAWGDQSGKDKHATQATPVNQPTYTDPLNGHNGVQCDVLSKYITINGATGGVYSNGVLANEWTLIAVVKRPAGSGAYRPLWSNRGGAVPPAGQSVVFWGHEASGTPLVAAFCDQVTPSVQLNGGAWGTTPIILELSSSNVTKRRIHRANNVATGTDVADQDNLATRIATGTLGRDLGGTGLMDVTLYEILHISRLLTTTERTKLYTYFSTQWGI